MELDENGDGNLSLKEILNAPASMIAKINEALGNSPITGPRERKDFDNQMTNLFAILDSDESKTLSIEEFCTGIARVMNGSEEQDRLDEHTIANISVKRWGQILSVVANAPVTDHITWVGTYFVKFLCLFALHGNSR